MRPVDESQIARDTRILLARSIEKDHHIEFPLLKKIQMSLTIAKALDCFKTNTPSLFSIAHDFITANLSDHSLFDEIALFLRNEDRARIELLKSLYTMPLPDNTALQEALVYAARARDQIVAELAARVIGLAYPQEVSRITDNPGNGILRGLCYSKRAELLEPLIQLWGRDIILERPPTALGILINPQALAHLWEKDEELGFVIANSFGYLDDSLDKPSRSDHKRLCSLLREGLSVVDPSFSTDDIETLKQRESNLIKALLPWSTGMTGPIPEGFSLAVKIDRLLFFSAARSTEKANLDLKMDENPHTDRQRRSSTGVDFMCRPVSYLCKELVQIPMRAFTLIGAPRDLFTDYAIEYANCRMELDAQIRDEQLLLLESRWAFSAKTLRPPERLAEFPVACCNVHPELTMLVLPKRPKISALCNGELSLGAQSTQELMSFTEREDFIASLARVEDQMRSILPTVGIELQCQFSTQRRSESLPWKQALRHFGIPSPRRPDCHAMVEAAFLPAYSYHAHVASIILLKQLQFFKGDLDIALHISLSGQLGSQVRYLLFAQQFAAAPTNSRPGRKLMSKGFAHLHRDAINPTRLSPNKTNPYRTELRSMRINMSDLLGSNTPDFIDEIASFQLLGGALVSKNSSLKAIWDRFCQSIDVAVTQLPPAFRSLLDANWYEWTGDSTDSHLMMLLDIVEKRNAVGRSIKLSKDAEVLRKTFRDIRNSHAREVLQAISPTQVFDQNPRHFSISKGGIPFLNPALAPKKSQ
jgi:hypothetical protein